MQELFLPDVYQPCERIGDVFIPICQYPCLYVSVRTATLTALAGYVIFVCTSTVVILRVSLSTAGTG